TRQDLGTSSPRLFIACCKRNAVAPCNLHLSVGRLMYGIGRSLNPENRTIVEISQPGEWHEETIVISVSCIRLFRGFSCCAGGARRRRSGHAELFPKHATTRSTTGSAAWSRPARQQCA